MVDVQGSGVGGPFVECKKPVDAQELAYCLATQTRRDPPLCPPEFETQWAPGCCQMY